MTSDQHPPIDPVNLLVELLAAVKEQNELLCGILTVLREQVAPSQEQLISHNGLDTRNNREWLITYRD